MRSIVIGFVAGGLGMTAVPAMADETTLRATVRGYQAPDFSQNFTQVSASPDIAFVGVLDCTDLRYCGFALNGRLAATMEFALPALPEFVVVTGARLGFANFERYSGPNFYEVRSYTAASIAADPAEIYAGAYFTTFQLQPQFTGGLFDPNNPLISFDVTSIVAADLVASANVLGFSFRQTVDNCGFDGLFGGGYECTARFGDNGAFERPVLQISYDIRPPQSPMPEPTAWAMLLGGFGLVGGALRRRQRAITVSQ